MGQLARYEGVYRPHWETGHVGVRVPRRRKLLACGAAAVALLAAYGLGVTGPLSVAILGGVVAVLAATPAGERWAAEFPPDFEGAPAGARIRFEGVVTARGWYGHRGCMDRRVDITRVLPSEPA